MGGLEDMLAELEASLGPLDGEPVPLDGGITNHNFRVRLGGADYVVRRHGRETALLGIDREAERLAGEAAAALGVAPAIVAVLAGGLVTSYVECEPLAAEELRARVGELGRALRRFHDSGVELPARFWVPDLLERYAAIVRERGGTVPEDYERAVAVVRRIAAALPPAAAAPCHNDLLPGNIIRARDGGALLIVDWEYAGMGHPLFDLGNLAVNNDLGAEDERRLLGAYLGRPPSPSEWAELRLMRLLSDAREAAWGVVQGAVSELDFDFAAYASSHFERLLAAARDEDFEGWLAAA